VALFPSAHSRNSVDEQQASAGMRSASSLVLELWKRSTQAVTPAMRDLHKRRPQHGTCLLVVPSNRLVAVDQGACLATGPEGDGVALRDRRVQVRSRWVKADRLHPPIPHETLRWGKLSAAPASERAFGRLKNEWALLPPRARGVERVQLHADLTILATLAVHSPGREPFRSAA
jgi:hypothetical protein